MRCEAHVESDASRCRVWFICPTGVYCIAFTPVSRIAQPINWLWKFPGNVRLGPAKVGTALPHSPDRPLRRGDVGVGLVTPVNPIVRIFVRAADRRHGAELAGEFSQGEFQRGPDRSDAWLLGDERLAKIGRGEHGENCGRTGARGPHGVRLQKNQGEPRKERMKQTMHGKSGVVESANAIHVVSVEDDCKFPPVVSIVKPAPEKLPTHNCAHKSLPRQRRPKGREFPFRGAPGSRRRVAETVARIPHRGASGDTSGQRATSRSRMSQLRSAAKACCCPNCLSFRLRAVADRSIGKSCSLTKRHSDMLSSEFSSGR